ncbi:hypothetical protein EJB05_37114, partial [Eragrostis curvula]
MAAAPLEVPRMKLGSQGLEVSAQGLGCMGMSDYYGPPKPEPDMIALIHHAVAAGVTLLDTSDVYGPHTNEILLGKVIKFGLKFYGTCNGWCLRRFALLIDAARCNACRGMLGQALQGGVREKVQLATKFGVSLPDSKSDDPAYEGMEVRGDPAYVRAACEASLRRLGVDCIDLYYVHRIDTRVPIESLSTLVPTWTSFGTTNRITKMISLASTGKIKYIGLSEASASTIRRAHAVHPITAVQLEWSLWTRDAEADIIPTCSRSHDFRELGIGIVAYSPLGMGFFSRGPKLVDTLSDQDFRKDLPRFRPENIEKNTQIFEKVNAMAARKGCTPSQLALAWVHHQGSDVCPIPGTTKIHNFNNNVAALSVKLTPEDMAELESYATANVEGGRTHDFLRTWKDSETPPLSSWKA